MATTPPGAKPRRTRRPANAAVLKKAPSEVHVGLADYISKTTGQEVDAQTVSVVQRLYPLYLKSPEVVAAREKVEADRKAEAERKEAEKRERLQARLAKIEEQRAKLLADLGEESEGEVVDASDRFTEDRGIQFAQPVEADEDEEPETEEESDEDDFEEDDAQAEEVEVAEESDEDEDDDWEDDEDDEEDF